MTRSRGQALVETAVALPVFLLAMFGVVWGLQSGVLGERMQSVARYGGMISAEIHPFQQYSLYAMYAAAGGNPQQAACVAPPSPLLSQSGPVASPAPAAAPFWQPSAGSASTSATCNWTASTAAGLTTPKVFGFSKISVDATSDVPAFLQPFMGNTMNQLRSPDMSAIALCYPQIAAAFEGSVAPPIPAPAPAGDVPLIVPDDSMLAPTGSCTGG